MTLTGGALLTAALLATAVGCGDEATPSTDPPAPATTAAPTTTSPAEVTTTSHADTTASGVADASTTVGAELATTMQRILADWYGPGDTGGAVAVVGTLDGQIHVAAVGEAAPGSPAGADDVMRIGSITKSYTAAIVLRLAERGLIDLDFPVADHLAIPGLNSQTTVRSLLDHTSGISDPANDELISAFRADPGHRFDTDELVALAHLPATDGATEFAYANANYHLLGMLIEQVTGSDYTGALHDEILDVAGLANTHLVGFEPVAEQVVPGNVDLDGDGSEDSLVAVPYDAVDTYGWSAGAIATTPADLVAFARALFDGTLLDDDSLAELTSDPQHDGYALGLVDVGDGTWGHNGGAPGYVAVFVHQPGSGVTAALFSNCPSCAVGGTDTWEIAGELLAAGGA